jgi:predicted CXXCH cytochrome family protein
MGTAQREPWRGWPHPWWRSTAGTFLVWLLGVGLAGPVPGQAQTKNSCLDCHALLPPPMHVDQESANQDIHTQKGLNCSSCHGGDPSQADPLRAMDPAKGFRGKITRRQIPKLCAECHSNAAYMRGFHPSLRTDQYSQYLTSVHGQRLSRGDTKVAVCTDCHGVHGIRPANDARSAVHPLRVAETCARCHADPEYMRAYGLPTNQFDDYRDSVHHRALAERGDLSAPTCSTCHGNHGAAPPGVAAVEFVCATCHVFQAQLFDGSPHKAAFAAMGLPACVTCHGNHRIVEPNDAMLGSGPESLCLRCHTEGDGGHQAAAHMHEQLLGLARAIEQAQQVLDRAEQTGMEVGQPKLDLAQARDALTKARVAIHGFQPDRVQAEVQTGLEVARAAQHAGATALAEYDFRRLGLAISLVLILIVVIGLRLYLKQLEANRLRGSDTP